MVNSVGSRVKRYIKNTKNKDLFLNICLFIMGSLVLLRAKYHLSGKPEELKKDAAKEE